MFTGIVEEKGTVLSCVEAAGSWRMKVAAKVALGGAALGDSVAVNGCCLTVVEIGPDSLSFDMLEETRRATNLSAAAPGASVNLERSLRFDGKIGGHFVTGHIDGTGEVREIRQDGKDVILVIETAEDFAKYLVYKGCIAVDGISLTVHRAEGNLVTIWLIPHTLAVTSLGERQPGDRVNLEFDLLAKYTENLLAKQTR